LTVDAEIALPLCHWQFLEQRGEGAVNLWRCASLRTVENLKGQVGPPHALQLTVSELDKGGQSVTSVIRIDRQHLR
jgi:hypothetical protein